MTDEEYAKDDKILNSNVLLNDVMKTIQLLVILLIIAFVIVVILVGSCVIFERHLLKSISLKTCGSYKPRFGNRPLLFGSSSRAPDNIMPTLGYH